MKHPNFNVQKITFLNHEGLFYLKNEVDEYIKENLEWFNQRELFDANREVYVQEYRKCQKECKRLREEISALRAARTPSVETRPSVDSRIIDP